MIKILIITLSFFFTFNLHSAESNKGPMPKHEWSFNGITGTFDRSALQRGFKVYSEVCAGCHSMKLLYYRDLIDIGFSEAQVKAIAAEYEVLDGPNDECEMFERPARPADRFVNPYLKKLGAIEITRKNYLKLLGKSLKKNTNFSKKVSQSSIYEIIHSMTQTS